MSKIALHVASAALASLLPLVAAQAACPPDGIEVIACNYPTLQAAVDAAIAADLPLLLPRGSYQGPVTIDYTPNASTGFELISRGATIYGGMMIQCEGSCFYFHQEGTLFVNGQSNGPLVFIGKPDFSDAHNSMKIEHLIANNGATTNATGVQLNYVLDSDLYIVADSAGGIGLDVRQLQFSVLKGSMSGGSGYAMMIRDGYVFANSFMSLDQEASTACLAMLSPHTSGNTWVSVYQDCDSSGVLSQSAMAGNGSVAGVSGNAIRQKYKEVP